MQYVTFQSGEYFTLLQGGYSTCFIFLRTVEIQCHVQGGAKRTHVFEIGSSRESEGR